MVLYRFLGGERERCGDPRIDLQLASGVLAMAINGAGLDAELASDLLGAEMRMNKAQTLPFAFCQNPNCFGHVILQALGVVNPRSLGSTR